MSNNGGPAFPSGSYVDGYREDGSEVRLARHEGMSLLDYFAAKAMAAILTHKDAFENSGETAIACMAYEQAEAMLSYKQNQQAVSESQQVALDIGGQT